MTTILNFLAKPVVKFIVSIVISIFIKNKNGSLKSCVRSIFDFAAKAILA
jgi:hypothetical protein